MLIIIWFNRDDNIFMSQETRDILIKMAASHFCNQSGSSKATPTSPPQIPIITVPSAVVGSVIDERYETTLRPLSTEVMGYQYYSKTM